MADVGRVIGKFLPQIRSMQILLTTNRIWRMRLQSIGYLPTRDAVV